MQHIVVQDPDGREHKLEAVEGWRVMEIIRENGLPIRADCGGSCACATCHVYVEESWAKRLVPADKEERDMLDYVPEIKDNSRLACQILYTQKLAGLKLELPPE